MVSQSLHSLHPFALQLFKLQANTSILVQRLCIQLLPLSVAQVVLLHLISSVCLELSPIWLILVCICLFWAAGLLLGCIVFFLSIYCVICIDLPSYVVQVELEFGAPCWAACIRLSAWLLLIRFHLMMHQGCTAFFCLSYQMFVLKHDVFVWVSPLAVCYRSVRIELSPLCFIVVSVCLFWAARFLLVCSVFFWLPFSALHFEPHIFFWLWLLIDHGIELPDQICMSWFWWWNFCFRICLVVIRPTSLYWYMLI